MLTVYAPAKINLGLEILGRRPDGFHEVRTILHAIALWDELTISPAPDLTLECAWVQGHRQGGSEESMVAESNPVDCSLPPLIPRSPPGDALGPIDDNLVLRAARLLRQATGVSMGARLRLRKAIPVAAGLGGGSADAAAALVGLNQLWELGLAPNELSRLAAELGSDVPFFLTGGAALASGRGERLEPLPSAALGVVLALARSSYPDKTRRLYAALEPSDWSPGYRVERLAELLRQGSAMDWMWFEMALGDAPHRPTPSRTTSNPFFSGFERATRQLFPEVDRAFEVLASAGGAPSLCGAGPTVLSLHLTEAEARTVADKARADGIETLVTTTTTDGVMTNRIEGMKEDR